MGDELSDSNVRLISDYDKMMVSISLSKATRLRHLQTLLSLSRLLGIDWKDSTKREIDEITFKIAGKIW
ncbi:MAG: hypothetical protein KGH99_07905 [Thaumarchaeota archaeon]|nr:hypothetical protein [Nitrososphaerota archaeon]